MGVGMPSQFLRQSSYRITILSALTLGVLSGVVIIAQLKPRTTDLTGRTPLLTPLSVADLPDAELERLAADVLARLTDRGQLVPHDDDLQKSDSFNAPLNPRHTFMGLRNARRLLPLAKQLTLETLRERAQVESLTKEARMIAGVNHLLIDRNLGDSAEVRDEDLSKIWIGPDYATDLSLDDEAILLLSHELTHVAVRNGRLNTFIDSVTTTARVSAGVELNHEQKEELACDFTAAEVLKRFIVMNPTSESSTMRFSLAFGYENPEKRLARAWADFCASYKGESRDKEHLSRDQTIRSLLVLDEEFKSFVPDDAVVSRFCR